jgi:hypothetical protein
VPAPGDTEPPDDDVPLLDDVVDGGLTLDEAPLAQLPDIDDSEPSRIDDALFELLLGDEWREAAAGVLEDARGQIEKHSDRWAPEHTDELNEALRVRIDAAIQTWLEELVMTNMADLRQSLVSALADTLDDQIRKNLASADDKDNNDGS